VLAAAHLINRTLNGILQGKSPYEILIINSHPVITLEFSDAYVLPRTVEDKRQICIMK